jgi:hypothetical protein
VKRLLVVRHFKRPTGGNISVRDFFRHALAHAGLETRIYFAPGSCHAGSEEWVDLPPDRVVDAPDWPSFDVVMVNGKDWRLIPDGGHRFRVIHLVQHLGYGDDPELRSYLRRPALRICLSDAVQESIAPYASGPSCVIPSGVDPALFFDDGTRQPGTVFIWGGKNPAVADGIARALESRGVRVHAAAEWLPRPVFASRLRASDVFVALPMPREGFFRPAVEAMACGCAVVCSDALGNRAHCLNMMTCLQPPHGDSDAHVDAACRLLADDRLREQLRRQGQALAKQFDLAVERRRVHRLLDDLVRS